MDERLHALCIARISSHQSHTYSYKAYGGSDASYVAWIERTIPARLEYFACGWLEGVRGFAVGMCPVVVDFPTGDARTTARSPSDMRE